MKTLNFAIGIAVISSATVMTNAQAGSMDSPSLQQMPACFKAHSQLMEKPAVRNLYDCWRAHGYLMQDQTKHS